MTVPVKSSPASGQGYRSILPLVAHHRLDEDGAGEGRADRIVSAPRAPSPTRIVIGPSNGARASTTTRAPARDPAPRGSGAGLGHRRCTHTSRARSPGARSAIDA